MARKRRRYTDDFRASAVVLLEAAGYPDKEGALAQASRRMQVPHNTLRNWYHAKHNPAPAELRQQKKLDLQEALESELAAIFSTLAGTRQDANYRELATAVGIFTDKLFLLQGKPTARTEETVTLEDARSALDRINSRVDSIAQRIAEGSGAIPAGANGTGPKSP